MTPKAVFGIKLLRINVHYALTVRRVTITSAQNADALAIAIASCVSCYIVQYYVIFSNAADGPKIFLAYINIRKKFFKEEGKQ